MLYRRADYQSPRPLAQTSIFIYIVRFFYIRKAFHRNEISFFSFYRLKILSGKKIFLFCIGSIYHGCETCKKTCQLSERRKSIELLTQFCCRSKSPCLQKTTLIFHEDFCFSGMDIYHKECL